MGFMINFNQEKKVEFYESYGNSYGIVFLFTFPFIVLPEYVLNLMIFWIRLIRLNMSEQSNIVKHKIN